MARVAVVTGGTRGIGAAICRALKDEGYLVAANYASNHNIAETFNKDTGIPVYSWNVASYEDCEKGIAQIEKDLGPVDILVNNAGITRDSAFHKMSESDWTSVIDINLRSCFTMSRAVIDGMRSRSFGRIINISSINGQSGQFGQTNYAAAKAGMIGFTKALALEGARKGIRVNAIAPGYINTEMVAAIDADILSQIVEKIPVGRLGEPNEIARVVLFLASDDSGFITGATVSVNGGQYLV